MTIKKALEILRKEYRYRTMNCPDSVPVTSCDWCDFNTELEQREITDEQAIEHLQSTG